MRRSTHESGRANPPFFLLYLWNSGVGAKHSTLLGLKQYCINYENASPLLMISTTVMGKTKLQTATPLK